MRKLHTDVQMRITFITVKSTNKIDNLRLKLELPNYTQNKTTNWTTLNQNNIRIQSIQLFIKRFIKKKRL